LASNNKNAISLLQLSGLSLEIVVTHYSSGECIYPLWTDIKQSCQQAFAHNLDFGISMQLVHYGSSFYITSAEHISSKIHLE